VSTDCVEDDLLLEIEAVAMVDEKWHLRASVPAGAHSRGF
jgi:hypothetical protein